MATVLDDLILVARACERPAKRGEVTRSCIESSTTPSTTAFSALLNDGEDHKSRCELITLANHCIFGLATETKERLEKLADLERLMQW